MKFPTWNSDLLLIKHSTGVLTSQTYTKQLNRDGELLADAAERAAVSAVFMSKVAYPSEQLLQGWKLLLRNQYHDILIIILAADGVLIGAIRLIA